MLKRATLAEPYWYGSQYDPAVNREHPEFDELWEKYRLDVGPAPLKEGQTHTEFKLRHLTAEDLAFLADYNGGELNSIRAQTGLMAARFATITARNLELDRELPSLQDPDSGPVPWCVEWFWPAIDDFNVQFEVGLEAIRRRLLSPT